MTPTDKSGSYNQFNGNRLFASPVPRGGYQKARSSLISCTSLTVLQT